MQCISCKIVLHCNYIVNYIVIEELTLSHTYTLHISHSISLAAVCYISIIKTSSKYPFSGRSKLLSRPCGPLSAVFIALDLFSRPFGFCPAEVIVLLAFTRWHLLLRYCYCYCYCAHVSLLFTRCRCHEFYYTACIDKWPWPWLKHSLGHHESLCQVWSWSAQPFGRPLATYRQTNIQS